MARVIKSLRLKQLDKNMGAIIRKNRKEQGVSQGELARYLRITPQQMGHYELGQSTLDWYTLHRICDKLGLRYSQVMIGVGV
jgi:transcriptional regulator with XRE-family HTH domain